MILLKHFPSISWKHLEALAEIVVFGLITFPKAVYKHVILLFTNYIYLIYQSLNSLWLHLQIVLKKLLLLHL